MQGKPQSTKEKHKLSLEGGPSEKIDGFQVIPEFQIYCDLDFGQIPISSV